MKPLNHPPSLRQRGAIAVLTGLLLIFVFVPLGGLVVDLGHLYIAKAELQNAADAAALAAAKDLNNKADGIDAAIAYSIVVVTVLFLPETAGKSLK